MVIFWTTCLQDSNTQILEQQFGWDGLCIPMSRYTPGLHNRRCKVAVALVGLQTGQSRSIRRTSAALNGNIGRKGSSKFINLTTINLQRILHDFGVPRVIDYVVLNEKDTELLLNKFPGGQYTVHVIQVLRPGEPLKFLTSQQYVHIRVLGGLCDIYIHRHMHNFHEIINRISSTPNVEFKFETNSHDLVYNTTSAIHTELVPITDNIAKGLATVRCKLSLHTSSLAKCMHTPVKIGIFADNGWKVVAYFRGTQDWTKFNEKWTSQVGQDRIVIDILRGKRGGYFIDFASNDAVKLSNTLTLEQEFGWEGLCIEPNPVYFPGLLQRKCQLAVAVGGERTGQRVQFSFAPLRKFGGEFGGIIGRDFRNKRAKEAVNLTTVSIEKVLVDFNVPHIIDYLSLDIEGAEFFVFRKFPWRKYVFHTITVEEPKELSRLLTENGYVLIKILSGLDWVYVHRSIPHFNEVVTRYGRVGQYQ